MSADKRALYTGRSGKVFTGPVIVLPKSVLDTDEMRALPASATKLLLSILPQYNGPGINNGAIRILMRQPCRYGFKSGSTLTQARNDLLRAGFLQITRQGGKNIASLYAFTWMGVDRVSGIDVKADPTPSHLWRKQNAEQREMPTRGRRKARALDPQKNAKPAPVIGATPAKTAPVIGTTPAAIAPVIGAVRAKTGAGVAPVSGTDSCIAMGCAEKLGVEPAAVTSPKPGPGSNNTLQRTSDGNQFDRARQRWEHRRENRARCAAKQVAR
jgi:hypothetical protein